MRSFVVSLLVTCASLGVQAALMPDFTDPKVQAERREQIRPVAPGVFRLRPTFCSCGITFGTEAPIAGLRLEFRKRGGWLSRDDWKAVSPSPVFSRESMNVRAAITGLEEGTEYEARLIASDGAEVTSGAFETWTSKVPVARRVEIDPATFVPPLRIAEKGAADGWIEYVVKGGCVLTNLTDRPTLTVDGAAFVLLDGIRFYGGRIQFPVTVENSDSVRFRRCEFTGWGRLGKPRYDKDGKFYGKDVRGRETYLNWDAALRIGTGTTRCVVERCYFHGPVYGANSWRYSHPAGPCGILMDRPDHSTVIRHCDFVGSDARRFNDAVEGVDNFKANGGFNQDADVYGNFMAFCNDDNIEIDGGQQNVRVFGNRFEGALSGVSIQGCMVSPVYVFDNLFSGMGDIFGITQPPVKIDLIHGPEARSFVWKNVFWGPSGPLYLTPTMACELDGNVFEKGVDVVRQKNASSSRVGENAMQASVDRSVALEWPRRPLPFTLSRGFIDVGTSRTPVTVSARTTRKIGFAVERTDDSRWFSVEPSAGTLDPDRPTVFTVTFDEARMRGRRNWRGAFLVRTPGGLSRPVTVYARNPGAFPFRPDLPPSATAVFAGPFAAERIGTERSVAFDVPKDGTYWFLVRARTPGWWTSIECAVDGDAYQRTRLSLGQEMYWTMLAPGRDDSWTAKIRPYGLSAGRHTLRVRAAEGAKPVEFEGFVVTDSPAAFEPL